MDFYIKMDILKEYDYLERINAYTETKRDFIKMTNDLISRQDLMPWLACLFVKVDHRNKGVAGSLLDHGLNEAKMKGFQKLYLYTDLENFYERKGWNHMCNGYNVATTEVKIYVKETD